MDVTSTCVWSFPVNKWRVHIGPSLQIHLPTAPHAIFRWTQRIVFGFRWERLP